MKLRILSFLIILLVAVFLRLYMIAQIPPSPSLDEVSIGYNAYSIFRTGADEYGTKLPILLRAYDDWRPALYVYLVIPFIKLLGLSILSVRLPSVLLSIFTVIATFFLVRVVVILSKKEMEYKYLDLLAMFFISISPWHIYISRLGHEVNAAFSFLLFGILFFFLFIHYSRLVSSGKSLSLLLSSAVFFALSFDSYQSTKVVIPLLLVSAFILFFKEIISHKKAVVISCLIGITLILPVVIKSFEPQALIRFQATSVFEQAKNYSAPNSHRRIDDKGLNTYIGKLIHNKYIADASVFTGAYLSHLNPTWLFINQNVESFKVPNVGILYIIDLPFLVIGIIMFYRMVIPRKYKIFISLWLIIGIIPGALTNDYPHVMRIINILPVPQLFIAVGVLYILRKFSHSIIPIGLLYFLSFVFFFHAYFVDFPIFLSSQFQYGVTKALLYSQDHEAKYDHIIVSNQGKLVSSYMYYLFVSKLNPQLYQSTGGTQTGWFDHERTIGKYEFKRIWDMKSYPKKSLFILNPMESIQNLSVIKKIYYLDGKEAIVIAESSK